MLKLITLIGFAVSSVGASTITFNTLPANTDFGTFNGYVISTVDDQPNQPLVCDDFAHTTYVPSGKLAFNLSTVTGPNPLEYARFVNIDPTGPSLFKYEEASFLLDGLNQTGPGSLLDLTAEYQYALWHLFTPAVPLPNATAQTLLNDAAAGVTAGGADAGMLYSRLRIYTPTAAYASNQEFLQLVPAPDPHPWTSFSQDAMPTPEPSSAWLFGVGGGLIALGCTARRLRRRRAGPPSAEADPRTD